MRDNNNGAISYFNLLCELEEAECEHNTSKSDGSCCNEVSDRYNRVKKIKAKVAREGKTLDGMKQQRTGWQGASTQVIHAYVKKFPNGSVTVSTDEAPSLFDWAIDNIDREIGNAEIVSFKRHQSITFLNTTTNTKSSLALSSLKSALSYAKRKLKQK